MKLQFIFFLSLLLSLLLSCSNSKEKFNTELAEKMKLEVNYINNQMPSTDNSSSKYISFLVFPPNDSFKENWRTISLTAISGETKVQVLKFDKNKFEAKGEKVYRNSARMGLEDLNDSIEVTIILESESGERIKLNMSNIKEEVVH